MHKMRRRSPDVMLRHHSIGAVNLEINAKRKFGSKSPDQPSLKNPNELMLLNEQRVEEIVDIVQAQRKKEREIAGGHREGCSKDSVFARVHLEDTKKQFLDQYKIQMLKLVSETRAPAGYNFLTSDQTKLQKNIDGQLLDE